MIRLPAFGSVVATLMVASLSVGTLMAQAQPPRPGAKQTWTDQVLTARDGWPIHITYFESTGGKESPAVVLIANAEGNDAKDARTRRVWEKTALDLQKSGFAVVTVDLRKHGDSVPPAETASSTALRVAPGDYAIMAGMDLEAVKEFLVNEHHAEKLNVRKLGVVAVGSSAMVASAFAVADWDKKPYPDAPLLEMRTPRGQDVKAIMMISPNTTVKGLNSTAIFRTLKGLPVAVHILASSNIKSEARDADKVFKSLELKAEEAKDARKVDLFPVDFSGERFLEGREAVETNKMIVEFLTKSTKDLNDPWRTRKSRL